MTTIIVPRSHFVRSPNAYPTRQGYEPEYLIWHYTVDPKTPKGYGNGDAFDVAAGFASAGRVASADFVMGRDGEIVQCVELGRAAWGAGDGKAPPARDHRAALRGAYPRPGLIPRTQALDDPARPETAWAGFAPVGSARKELNQRAVHVEVCNLGCSSHVTKLPAKRRAVATHANPGCRKTLWEAYSEEQRKGIPAFARVLFSIFPTIKFMMGHEDATNRHTLGKTGGKTDPGPVFPWDELTDVAFAYGVSRMRFVFGKGPYGWVYNTVPDVPAAVQDAVRHPYSMLLTTPKVTINPMYPYNLVFG